MSSSLDRSLRFFGQEGQAKLGAATVAVVGVGGLGTHVVQQLSLHRVGALSLIDDEVVDETNLNRYVGAGPDDTGRRKVDIGLRLANGIDSGIRAEPIFDQLLSHAAFEAIKNSSHVFGCVDNDGARLVLTELCAAYALPYIDLASDIIPGEPPDYGGRVCTAWDADGCPVCLGEIDLTQAREDLATPDARKDRADIYGVDDRFLDGAGPAVVSINGVVASLGVTEFMLAVTGVRVPRRLLTYHGRRGIVTVRQETGAGDDCYYCRSVRGRPQEANVERYLEPE